MKSIRIPLLAVFFCVSLMAAYSQDSTTGNSSDNTGLSGTVQDEAVTGTSGNEDVKGTAESGTSDKTGSSVRDNSEKSQNEKKQGSDSKTAVNREKETVKTDSGGDTSTVRSDATGAVLLQINEGNFKYKRIPDIKLPEIQVQAGDSQSGDNTSVQTPGSDNNGFLGMSKTASDIIVFGGIIIFIYIIFFLSRSRMKGSGGKKSNRKVLNSYRK